MQINAYDLRVFCDDSDTAPQGASLIQTQKTSYAALFQSDNISEDIESPSWWKSSSPGQKAMAIIGGIGMTAIIIGGIVYSLKKPNVQFQSVGGLNSNVLPDQQIDTRSTKNKIKNFHGQCAAILNKSGFVGLKNFLEQNIITGEQLDGYRNAKGQTLLMMVVDALSSQSQGADRLHLFPPNLDLVDYLVKKYYMNAFGVAVKNAADISATDNENNNVFHYVTRISRIYDYLHGFGILNNLINLENEIPLVRKGMHAKNNQGVTPIGELQELKSSATRNHYCEFIGECEEVVALRVGDCDVEMKQLFDNFSLPCK